MAKIQAQWLTHKFEIKQNRIAGLEGLDLAKALKYDKQDVKGGKPKILDKGLEQENIPLSYTPALVAGSDPRAEFDSWREDLGKSGALYLGGKRWGKVKYILTNVNLSTSLMNNSGVIQLANINIELKQDYLNETIKKDKKNETKQATTAVKVGPTTAEKKKKLKGEYADVEKR